jgi:hypothetical protein
MTLQIRVLRTLDECRTIRDDWARLIRLEGGGIRGFDVSATFEWLEALWQNYPNGAPQGVLVAEDDSGVRGLLPCFISPGTIGRVPHHQLTLTATIYDLRTGFLVAGDAHVLEQLIDMAFAQFKGWSTFIFSVVDESPSDVAIHDVFRRRNLEMKALQYWRSPHIPLPADPAQVVENLPSKLRYNVRRGEKQLRGLGRLETQFFDTEDSVPKFLELMEVVEGRSWKLVAGTSMNTSARQKKLYSVVTSAMAKDGRFLGVALVLNDQPVAFIYGYAFEGVFVDEKESYDERYKEYGPGNVLKTRFLEELVRRGIRTHDYAGREDTHKARWTNQVYSRHTYVVYNNTVLVRLIKVGLWAEQQRLKLRGIEFGERRGVSRLDRVGAVDPGTTHWTDLSRYRRPYVLFRATLRDQFARVTLGLQKWLA